MFTSSKNDHHATFHHFAEVISAQSVFKGFADRTNIPCPTKYQLKVLIFLVLLLMGLSNPLYSQIITKERKTKKIPFSYYISKDQSLNVHDIIKGSYPFKSTNSWNLYDIDVTYWVKLDFINELDTLETQENWYFISSTFIRSSLYLNVNDSIVPKPYGKYNKTEPNASLLYTNGVLFKKENLIDGRYLYVRFEIDYVPRINVKFTYVSEDGIRFITQYYTRTELNELLPEQNYIGACAIIFLTFLIIFLYTRKLEFLFYALYVIFSLIYLAKNINIHQYQIFYDTYFGSWFVDISQIMINLFYVCFAMYYLDTKLNYPKLHKLMRIILPLLLLLVLADFWSFFSANYQTHQDLLNFQRILMSLFGMASMIYLIIKAMNKLAIFMVIGSCAFLIGALAYLFTNNGHYMMIGSILEIIIFFLGLAYKIKLEYEARLSLQQEVSSKEISALRAQMNPHFIFNSLSSIQNLILKNDRASALKYLSQFGKLVRNVLESSNEAIVTLTEEIALLKSYLELESLRFDNAFEYTIDVDEDLDADSLEIPLMLIQPFVENAIIHGLVGKKKGEKKLSLRFKKDGQFAVFEIEDNGIGRIASGAFGDPSKKQRKSRGMEITEKRLKIFNKNKVNQNKVEIVDKYDANGNATGTKVIIQIFNP